VDAWIHETSRLLLEHEHEMVKIMMRADAFVGAKRMSNARIEFFCGTHRAPRSQNI
jgi:hypothetical protein